MSLGELVQRVNVRAYHKMENLNDSSGNGFTMTTQGDPDLAWAKFRRGYYLDGNDYIYHSGVPDLGTQFTSYSWFKLAAQPAPGGIATVQIIGSSNSTYHFVAFGYRDVSGVKNIFLRCGQAIYLNVAITLNTGQWYLMGVTGDTNRLVKLYLNGVYTGMSQTTGSDAYNYANRHSFGGWPGVSYYLNGYFDESGCILEAKSDSWWRKLYASGKGLIY